MNFDKDIFRFRSASRDLFNQYFRVDNPYESGNDGWMRLEYFGDIESLLFKKMILDPHHIGGEYGQKCSGISVKLRDKHETSALINREIDSPYWDFSINTVNGETDMRFVSFFDWDSLGWRDNYFVRVEINNYPGKVDINGKHALIPSFLVDFEIVDC